MAGRAGPHRSAAPARRRGRARRSSCSSSCVVLAVLVVRRRVVLRGVVDRPSRQQVEQSLPDGTTVAVEAHAEGSSSRSSSHGSLDHVDDLVGGLTVDGIPLAADVDVQDVPMDGKGDVRDVDGTVTLGVVERQGPGEVQPAVRPADPGSRRRASNYAAQLRRARLTTCTDAATATPVAQDDGRGITITPKTAAHHRTRALGLEVDPIPARRHGVAVPVLPRAHVPRPRRAGLRSLDARSRTGLPLTADGAAATGGLLLTAARRLRRSAASRRRRLREARSSRAR